MGRSFPRVGGSTKSPVRAPDLLRDLDDLVGRGARGRGPGPGALDARGLAEHDRRSETTMEGRGHDAGHGRPRPPRLASTTTGVQLCARESGSRTGRGTSTSHGTSTGRAGTGSRWWSPPRGTHRGHRSARCPASSTLSSAWASSRRTPRSTSTAATTRVWPSPGSTSRGTRSTPPAPSTARSTSPPTSSRCGWRRSSRAWTRSRPRSRTWRSSTSRSTTSTRARCSTGSSPTRSARSSWSTRARACRSSTTTSTS
ncbi:hypothetical protein D3C74_317110 [compost metagenome]